MFDFLVMVRLNKSVGLHGILNICLVRDAFPYWVARGNSLKEGVQ
jgi:hypothetical protein